MNEEKPTPAEAATDIGQDDPDFYSREMMLEEAAKFAVSFLVATTVVLTIAALVWYYVTTP